MSDAAKMAWTVIALTFGGIAAFVAPVALLAWLSTVSTAAAWVVGPVLIVALLWNVIYWSERAR